MSSTLVFSHKAKEEAQSNRSSPSKKKKKVYANIVYVAYCDVKVGDPLDIRLTV